MLPVDASQVDEKNLKIRIFLFWLLTIDTCIYVGNVVFYSWVKFSRVS